jgi:hypothetical protein
MNIPRLFEKVYKVPAVDAGKLNAIVREYGPEQVVYTLQRIGKAQEADPYRHLDGVCQRMAARYQETISGRMMKNAPARVYRPADTSGSVRNNTPKQYRRRG